MPFSHDAVSELHDELRTAPLARTHPGQAAVPLGNLPDNRQARSRPLDFASDGPLKELKDAFGVAGRHAGTAIAHDQTFADRVDGPGPIRDDFDVGLLTVAGEFERIGHQVENGLRDPALIRGQVRQAFADNDAGARSLDARLELLQHVGDHLC